MMLCRLFNLAVAVDRVKKSRLNSFPSTLSIFIRAQGYLPMTILLALVEILNPTTRTVVKQFSGFIFTSIKGLPSSQPGYN